MQLDDLQRTWAQHSALLERSLALDERILRELLVRKARFALAPYALGRALEVAVGVAALGLVTRVLAQNPIDPLYLSIVGATVLYFVGIVATSGTLLVRALQLDHAEPVTALQRRVERMKLIEYAAFQWAFLGGVVLWLPIPIVLLEALSGAPLLARVDSGWLAANLACGALFAVAVRLWARAYVERSDARPWARKLRAGLSPRSLRRATEHLDELARFTDGR